MDGKAAEAAWVYEANIAGVGEGEDCVGVWRDGDVGLRDEEAAGHAEVDEELYRLFLALNRHDNRFANAAHGFDGGTGEGFGNLGLRRLEGLGLAAGPDTHDALAGDAGMDAVGYGFDFRKFRHELLEV